MLRWQGSLFVGVVGLLTTFGGCGRLGFEPLAGDSGDPDGGGDVPPMSCASDDDCGRCERCTAQRCQAATFVQLSFGLQNGCARDELGEVWCWGRNIYYNQGIVDGSGAEFYARPRRIGLGDAADIAIGWGLGLARTTGGELWGWGSFSRSPDLAVGELDSTQTWVELSARMFNACALASSGTISCVGDNSSGQLGRGTAVLDQILSLAPLDGSTDWLDVAAGYATCARKQDSRIQCVGRNLEGMLGRGTVTPNEVDLADVDAGGWSSVSVGAAQVCGIRTDGSLWCWGRAPENGAAVDLATPTQVGSDSDWEWVDARSRYTCGARQGQLSCWGRTDSPFFQALGITSSAPAPLALPFDVGTHPVLGGAAACALDGGIWKCLGSNTYGEVGVDSTAPAITEPTRLCPGG